MAQGRKSILIIDSNAYLSGKIAEQLFTHRDLCRVAQCNSLSCAAVLRQAQAFDFVLMDALTVPVNDESFLRIKKQNAGSEIFVYTSKLTGAEYDVIKSAALEAGAAFFGDECELIERVRQELLSENLTPQAAGTGLPRVCERK